MEKIVCFYQTKIGSKSSLIAAAAILIVILLMLGQGYAQVRGAQTRNADSFAQLPMFDVVSIKPNRSGAGGISLQFTADGFRATNAPLNMIIRQAYGVEDDQILGEPNWVRSQRFDIEGKVEASDVPRLKILNSEQRDAMLRLLLVDRFKLAVHHETTNMSAYALIVAKNGPKLKEALPGDTYPAGIKGPDGVAAAGTMSVSHDQLTVQGLPIASLINVLKQLKLGRVIFDRTGLTGKYDFKLQWRSDENSAAMFSRSEDTNQNGVPDVNSSGPSIFTALQEQLGLKLESRRIPVETLAIDHIEMPSEN